MTRPSVTAPTTSAATAPRSPRAPRRPPSRPSPRSTAPPPPAAPTPATRSRSTEVPEGSHGRVGPPEGGPTHWRKDTVNSAVALQQTGAGFVEASTNLPCHERVDRDTGA